jgi:hypothetical protein
VIEISEHRWSELRAKPTFDRVGSLAVRSQEVVRPGGQLDNLLTSSVAEGQGASKIVAGLRQRGYVTLRR